MSVYIYPGLTRWLLNGETGLSSKAIARWLTGHTDGGRDHPRDPADFRRCIGLLDAAPLMRRDLHRMADCSPAWARLIERWDEIEALLREEMSTGTGRAPRTYALMQELIRPTRENRTRP